MVNGAVYQGLEYYVTNTDPYEQSVAGTDVSFHTVTVGTGASGAVIKLYDDSDGTCDMSAQFAAIDGSQIGTYTFDAYLSNGLCMKVTGATGVKVTFVFQTFN